MDGKPSQSTNKLVDLDLDQLKMGLTSRLCRSDKLSHESKDCFCEPNTTEVLTSNHIGVTF